MVCSADPLFGRKSGVAVGESTEQGDVARACQSWCCVLAQSYPSLMICRLVWWSSGQLRRDSYQSRGVRCRRRVTSSWASPSHWSARGPCSAILPGSGPRPGRGWSSSSGLSRAPGTVAWTVAWVMAALPLCPSNARASLCSAGLAGRWSCRSRKSPYSRMPWWVSAADTAVPGGAWPFGDGSWVQAHASGVNPSR